MPRPCRGGRWPGACEAPGRARGNGALWQRHGPLPEKPGKADPVESGGGEEHACASGGGGLGDIPSAAGDLPAGRDRGPGAAGRASAEGTFARVTRYRHIPPGHETVLGTGASGGRPRRIWLYAGYCLTRQSIKINPCHCLGKSAYAGAPAPAAPLPWTPHLLESRGVRGMRNGMWSRW